MSRLDRPFPLVPQSFHLHLVGERLFRGQKALPLDVGIHHEDHGAVTLHITDKGGDFLNPRPPASVYPAVELYQLNREQKKLEGIISQIPPELLAQLTKTERDARKNQERGKNR